MANARFQRGSGCYRCMACKRLTRDVHGDAVNCGLCQECYDIAGLENEISDYGDPDGSLERKIDALTKIVIAKGGQA